MTLYGSATDMHGDEYVLAKSSYAALPCSRNASQRDLSAESGDERPSLERLRDAIDATGV
jgi:hypothetical protein